MTQHTSHGFTRAFTAAYVTVLILIAGLVVGSAVMVAVSATGQIGDAAVINLSGKQRMLSQRIAQFAQRHVQESTPDSSRALTRLANEMLADHDALLNGDEDRGIMNPVDPSARKFYFQAPYNLDARVRAYVRHAIDLANETNGRSAMAGTHLDAILAESEAPLLTSLDDVVTHYENLSTAKIDTFITNDIVISAVLVAMLAAVGLFLFRPLVQRAEENLSQIIELAASVESKERRLSSILETLADGVVTIGADGTILSVNDAAKAIFGYGDGEMERQNFRAMLPKNERRGRVSFFGSYIRDGMAGPTQSGREIIGRKKDGSEFSMELSLSSLEVDGKHLFTSVVRDITDRKNAESLLKRQAWVMENIADAVILADPEGNIIDCNARAEDLTGYERIELLGTPVMDLMVSRTAEVRGSTRAEARQVTDTGGVWRQEFEIRRKDGVIRIFDNTTTGLLDDRGRLVGRVSVNRDVTEQREIDNVKNEFISVVSHELRTPLTSIMGSLGLIKSGAVGQLDNDISGMIEIAHSNSERLVRLINDILDLEKIEAGRMDFNISALDAMTLMNRAIADNSGFGRKQNVTLEVTSPVDGISVSGDQDKLSQVFANLLSNAVKYSPEGSTVEIGAHRRGEKIRFTVRDHGPGIPGNFRSRIFEKFSQADASATRKEGGTGLGLSICKTIVERLGGEIGFDSVEGQGTTFFFDLPEAEAQTPLVVPTIGKRALIIEDDQDSATTLRVILEQIGLTVDVATNIERARALIDDIGFDIITLDIALNGEDGFDLVNQIAASDKNAGTPVVVISGRSHESLPAVESSAIELAGWIKKPVDYKTLEKTIYSSLHNGVGAKPIVLHVEDDSDVRDVVEKILRDDADIVCAASLAEARDVLENTETEIDLVLLDLELGDGRGEELLPELRSTSGGHIPVVVFSANDMDRSAATERVVRVLQKSRTSNDDLASCVMSAIQRRRANRGDEVMSNEGDI